MLPHSISIIIHKSYSHKHQLHCTYYLNDVVACSNNACYYYSDHGLLVKLRFFQHVTRKVGDDFDIGANASAEEGAEGTEEASESGVDLILNHRLVETGFGKKADYMNYLKDYMKRVVTYLETNDKADQVESFKKNINGVMKGLLGRFSDLQFFTGNYEGL